MTAGKDNCMLAVIPLLNYPAKPLASPWHAPNPAGAVNRCCLWCCQGRHAALQLHEIFTRSLEAPPLQTIYDCAATLMGFMSMALCVQV